MAFASGSSSPFSAEINVTPLFDILRVLLIIFMVIVPVIPRGLDGAIPQPGKSSNASANPAVLSITSSRNGIAYSVNTQSVATDALGGTLRGIFASRQNRTLFIQADKSLNYGDVASAIGQAKAAGAETIAFMPSATR